MDAYQIARLRATKPVNEKAVSDVRAKLHCKLDALHCCASTVNLTLAQVGAYLYAIAVEIGEMGNRGYGAGELPETLATGLLRENLKPLWDGILFHADGKSSDYSGWGIRKNPHWSLVWMERYGTDTLQAQEIIEAAHEQALKENAEIDAYIESLRPQRMTDTLLGEAVEKLTSVEVAHIAAVAAVLSSRYHLLWLRRDGIGSEGKISHHFKYIYQNLHAEALAELQYRADRTPPAQRTKKATEAMVKDWAKASDLWEKGTEYFYSAAWIAQAVNAAAEPDFRVDYDRLPKQPAETAPVEWLSDGELVREFMRWCDAQTDPASIEYEDKVAMLDYIRTRLARAKGQQPKKNELATLKAAVLELEPEE